MPNQKNPERDEAGRAKSGDGASSTPPHRSGGSESPARQPLTAAKSEASGAATVPHPGSSNPTSSASPRSTADSSDKTFEVLECVVDCLDVVVREIPRGAGAQLKGAQDPLRRARDLIQGGVLDSSHSWKPSLSAPRSTIPSGSYERSTERSVDASEQSPDA